jgi:sugar phosphate isomerase/epimerase
LSDLLPIALERQLRLDVEADCASCASTPGAAEELCQRVCGLHLALDYSHFIYHGFSHEQIERLDFYAGHVHVRQASPGRIVEYSDRGAMDLSRLIGHLKQIGYPGRFCVEYLSCREAEECGVDVATETARMIAELDRCLRAPDSDKIAAPNTETI